MLESSWIGLVFAFFSGVFTFFSPRFLALAPSYLAYLVVTTPIQHEGKRSTFSVLCFVFGSFCVFGLTGLGLDIALRVVEFDYLGLLSQIGGVFVLLYGLYVLGLLPANVVEGGLTEGGSVATSRYFALVMFGVRFFWRKALFITFSFGLALSLYETSHWALLLYFIGFFVPFSLYMLGMFSLARLGDGGYHRFLSLLLGVLIAFFGLLLLTQALGVGFALWRFSEYFSRVLLFF